MRKLRTLGLLLVLVSLVAGCGGGGGGDGGCFTGISLTGTVSFAYIDGFAVSVPGTYSVQPGFHTVSADTGFNESRTVFQCTTEPFFVD
jgi:hypothetical protein